MLEPRQVHDWIAARDARSDFAYIVTPNVDHVVRLERAGPELHRTYSQAALCLCDSRILRRIARFLGVPLTLVSGSDLVATLFNQILRPRDRVCLIGGREGHKTSLMRLYPGIEVVQHIPPMGLQTNPEARAAATDFAARSGARVILLAVGSPQQELLAAEMVRCPGIKGTAMCIGASVGLHRRRTPPCPAAAAPRRHGMGLAAGHRAAPSRSPLSWWMVPRFSQWALRWWRAEHKRSEVNRAR